MPSTTGSTTCSASSISTTTSRPSGRATTPTSSRSKASGARFERLMDLFMERLEPQPGHAHLSLRAVRADCPQAADGALRDAGGRGRPPTAQGCARRSAARRPSIAAGVGRELLDQEDGAVLRVHSGDRPARCGFEHRGLRAVARARRHRTPQIEGARAHRALQQGRRRQQSAAPRLARRPEVRVRRGDRTGGPPPRAAPRRRSQRS